MVEYFTAHSQVAATATSNDIPVASAKKVTLYMNRTNHSAGSSTFTVTGSVDGVTFVALNNIISQVTNTNAQTLTRVASVALASNTNAINGLDLSYLSLKAIRVVCTIATDGKGDCLVAVEE